MPNLTAEDVRRAYMEQAPYTHWITEVQLEPLQLVVVDDASGKLFRVPVEVNGEEIVFGPPVEVAISYVDQQQVAASAGNRRVVRPLTSPRPGTGRRDRVIAAAVAAGKFDQSRVEHYRREWDEDPAGTEAVIGMLAGGPPIDVAAAAPSSYDDEFSHLWPPEPPTRRELADESVVLRGPSASAVWREQDRQGEAYFEWRQEVEAGSSSSLTEAEIKALFGDE